MVVAWRSGLPGTWVPGVHANCIHNEIAALQMRSLGSHPGLAYPEVGGDVRSCFKKIRNIARRYGGSRWSDLETAESYTGALRRRYLEAERSLREDGPISGRDVFLRSFLKGEKLGAEKDAKPRLIFPRSPRYNLRLASWLKPFEHWLWGYLTARRLFGGSNTRVVAKGLSPRRRANLILRKFNSFRDCVVMEVDAKAFEAHVSVDQLKEEHKVYLAAYGGDQELASVLSRQVFKGVTSGGVKFSRNGGRASGDYNTGMGNSIIMLAVLVGVLKSYRFRFDILVDGDNALVFCEQVNMSELVKTFPGLVLREGGHELVLDKPVTYPEGVRFGRSAPVNLGRGLGWTMVRDYRSVLSNVGASYKHLREPTYGLAWLHGVARCELSLARGIPVLQEAALRILRSTETRRRVQEHHLSDYFAVGAWLASETDVIEVCRETRLSFELAFGLSPEEQVLAEKSLPGVSWEDLVPQEWTQPSRRFEAFPGLYETWGDATI